LQNTVGLHTDSNILDSQSVKDFLVHLIIKDVVKMLFKSQLFSTDHVQTWQQVCKLQNRW